jgi:hypothetical protein
VVGVVVLVLVLPVQQVGLGVVVLVVQQVVWD